MWNSQVVILDEPTAALGVAQTRQVLELVRRLAEQGLAVVLISHNLRDVFEVADRHHRASARPQRGRLREGEDVRAGDRPGDHGGHPGAPGRLTSAEEPARRSRPCGRQAEPEPSGAIPPRAAWDALKAGDVWAACP